MSKLPEKLLKVTSPLDQLDADQILYSAALKRIEELEKALTDVVERHTLYTKPNKEDKG